MDNNAHIYAGPTHLEAGKYIYLFENVKSIREYERRIEETISAEKEKERGNAWEVLVEAYYATKRMRDYATIYPNPNRFPRWLRRLLNLSKTDKGSTES